MDPYSVWYHKDSKGFRLSSKIRKFKPSGQSDLEFALMVIDCVDKVLLTSCIAESLRNCDQGEVFMPERQLQGAPFAGQAK